MCSPYGSSLSIGAFRTTHKRPKKSSLYSQDNPWRLKHVKFSQGLESTTNSRFDEVDRVGINANHEYPLYISVFFTSKLI